MTGLTLYSTPNCTQCVATEKFLEAKGIEYLKVDLSDDSEALSMVRNLGYTAAPVVVCGDEHWSGFRPDKLSQVV
tara:strand:+ start:34 stop:258 length:225 start_codon:yes stop_codon:yes gene_type:complete